MKTIIDIIIIISYFYYRGSLKHKIYICMKNYKSRLSIDTDAFSHAKVYSWAIKQSFINILFYLLVVIGQIGNDLYALIFKDYTFEETMTLRSQFASFILLLYLILSFRMERRLDKLREML